MVPAVTKRLIEISDDLLAAAQRELGTSGISDTVRQALEEAVASSAQRARREEYLRWLLDGGMAELADPAERAKSWHRFPDS